MSSLGLPLPTENPEAPFLKGARGLPAIALARPPSASPSGDCRAGSGEAGGGILLRGRLTEDHRSILTPQAKVNYTTWTASGV